jgi:peptidyl-tRNA hydrolase, PTH1 family
MNIEKTLTTITAIIGLGNPGKRFLFTRHNIGFLVIDALAQKYSVTCKQEHCMEIGSMQINGRTILLIKPQTFMNDSGKVIPLLKKKGIESNNIAVVHDELEKPFGSITIKQGGSAKGHNGLRSIISYMDDNFLRIRCGIGRPSEQKNVADYVLEPFCEPDQSVQAMIDQAVKTIEQLLS